MSYTPPSSVQPFTLRVSDQDLSEWRQLLQLSKLGPSTYENQQIKENYGVTQKWLSETKDYWLNTFDWRAQESYINSFDNFRMRIEDIDVHFVAYFSEKKDAIPLILMHGWPGSIIEFLPMLDLIKKQYSKKDLPYHIVIPSLPGYTLSASTQPTDKNWTLEDTGRVVNQLMINLGFTKYLAQGGDVGSFVARVLAHQYDACIGIHLNLFFVSEQPEPTSLPPDEQAALARYSTWTTFGRGYAIEHGTRPSTIGHVLSSNPLALLAWIGEKFLEWSDETPSLDHILTNISLYWFTSGFPTSIYAYREARETSFGFMPNVPKSVGVSWFLHELMPAIKSVLEKNCDLVFYKKHAAGGHFAALEKPKELWQDVEEFAAKVWKGDSAKL